MRWFRKINRKVVVQHVDKTPPEATISSDAISVVWSEDKKSYGEILYANGAYKYRCMHLYWDEDMEEYYWFPVSNTASFFDTEDKAKKACEELMRSL